MTDYLSITRMTRQERRDWYASIRHDADEVAALVRHVAKTAWHSDHVESVEDAEAFGGGYLASLIGVGWGALPEMLNVAMIHAIDACRPQTAQVAS